MISWDVSPQIFELGPIQLRWYGVLFALGFYFGFQIFRYAFHHENRPGADLDPLLIYCVAGTLIGARLGHCFFYEPEYFLKNPLEVFKIWKGGLASHGGVLGMLFSNWVYSRRRMSRWPERFKKGIDLPWLWLMDRVAIGAALGSALIRLGNLMNSEIIGKPTESDWGFVFVRVDSVLRHPAQLYESGVYFLLFFLLWGIYRKMRKALPHGLLLGLFLLIVFPARWAIENFKESQVAFEEGLMSQYGFNLGQILSVPFAFIGMILLIRVFLSRAK